MPSTSDDSTPDVVVGLLQTLRNSHRRRISDFRDHYRIVCSQCYTARTDPGFQKPTAHEPQDWPCAEVRWLDGTLASFGVPVPEDRRDPIADAQMT